MGNGSVGSCLPRSERTSGRPLALSLFHCSRHSLAVTPYHFLSSLGQSNPTPSFLLFLLSENHLVSARMWQDIPACSSHSFSNPARSVNLNYYFLGAFWGIDSFPSEPKRKVLVTGDRTGCSIVVKPVTCCMCVSVVCK